MLRSAARLRSRLSALGSQLKGAVEAAGIVATRGSTAAITEANDTLPVVARLVIEVRSDGTHTLARGALEADGQATQLEARGGSPAQLARSLSRALLTAPMLLRRPSASTQHERPAGDCIGAESDQVTS
jgi:hypothetical protein